MSWANFWDGKDDALSALNKNIKHACDNSNGDRYLRLHQSGLCIDCTDGHQHVSYYRVLVINIFLHVCVCSVVENANPDNTFDIQYDDGDFELSVKHGLIEVVRN